MKIDLVIFGVAVSIFAIYFYNFQRLVSSLGLEQKKEFVERSTPGRFINLIIAVPVGWILLFEDFYIRAAASTLLILFLVVGSYMQNKRLRELGFPEELIDRLARQSYLAGASVLLVVLSFLL